jgi:hypothetical protein
LYPPVDPDTLGGLPVTVCFSPKVCQQLRLPSPFFSGLGSIKLAKPQLTQWLIFTGDFCYNMASLLQLGCPSMEGTDMSRSAYFMQECGTCGRSLRIRVEYLGKRVVCQHCKSQFCAADAVGKSNSPVKVESVVLKKADQLLAAADELKNRPR